MAGAKGGVALETPPLITERSKPTNQVSGLARLPAPAVAASAAPAAGPLRLGSCFVNVDCAPPELAAVESGDGLLSLFRIGHLDERESTGTSRITISQNAYAINLPIRLERAAQLVLGGVEAQIAYKNIFHGGLLPVREHGRRRKQKESGLTRVR